NARPKATRAPCNSPPSQTNRRLMPAMRKVGKTPGVPSTPVNEESNMKPAPREEYIRAGVRPDRIDACIQAGITPEVAAEAIRTARSRRSNMKRPKDNDGAPDHVVHADGRDRTPGKLVQVDARLLIPSPENKLLYKDRNLDDADFARLVDSVKCV